MRFTRPVAIENDSFSVWIDAPAFHRIRIIFQDTHVGVRYLTMMLEPPNDCVDPGLVRKALAASSSAISLIARGMPLAQVLACIVRGVEQQYPGSMAAIFVLEDGGHLRAAAAPDLPQDYCRAVEGVVVVCGTGARPTASTTEAAVVEAVARLPGSDSTLNSLARRFGLHICSSIPIRSTTDRLLGMLVAYSRGSDQCHDVSPTAMQDASALASIAIACSQDETKKRAAESSSRDNEAILALAIEGSGTGIWDRNVATGEIHYSAGWKAILGYADTELGNRIEDSYSRLHPDDLGLVRAAMQAHFDQKTKGYEVVASNPLQGWQL